MSNENPFYLSKIECPICKTINEYETVKVGSYLENGRDTDFCPMMIKWRYPRYQSYNPLVFFTAVCGNCFYTREFSNSYKEWKNDNNFRSFRLKNLKEKHLDQLATANSVIKSFGENIDMSRHPNESAIIKIHLAIFDELLCDRVNNLDLGRFYLRVGWVYRDLDNGENPNEQFLKGLIIEVDSKLAKLKNAINENHGEIDIFNRYLNAHFDTNELSTDIKSQMLPYREKFRDNIQSINDSIAQTEAKIETVSKLMSEYKGAIIGSDSSGVGFGNYSNFTDFMLNIKERWPDAVTCEKAALEKAVYYYKEAFNNGREITPGNQQIQASYLIAELSRRIGAHDEAKQYFNTTIKSGQEFIYKNRNDKSRIALTRKILELAIEQGKLNMEAIKSI